MSSKRHFTFDDVLLLPAHSSVVPRDVSLQTRLTSTITLNIPLLSAAMDTVTEARLAIAIAQEGGMGVVHKNMTPKAQAAEVAKVKRFESGVVKDPITIPPTMSVREVLALTRQHRISGLPVVDGKKMVGIVTNRDLRFETSLDQPVANIMTKRDKLVTVPEGTELGFAKELMHRHRLERVLVVNDGFELKGLITVKDILKSTEHPFACKDELGQLRVGAAVGTGGDTVERVEGLVAAGVDVMVVDTSHGHSQGVLDRVRWIKRTFPEAAGDRWQHCDRRRRASACRSRCGRRQGRHRTRIDLHDARRCRRRRAADHGDPRCAGGRRRPGRAADRRRRHSLFRATSRRPSPPAHRRSCLAACLRAPRKSPGDTELYQGRSYKSYRGMGSLGAMQQGSADRYFQDTEGEGEAEKLVPEGIEGRVPYKGTLAAVIHQLTGGMRAAMGYCGCSTIDAMRKDAEFVEITTAGIRESHVHDVQITKEAPNYRVE